MRPCPSCHSDRTVPVLDVRLTRQPGGGNPYRIRCLECATNFLRTGKSNWANHTHPHVLPRTADPEESGAAVPLWEYDGVDDLPSTTPDPLAVIERSRELRDQGHEYEIVELADGDPDGAAVDEEPEPETINRFDCPDCGDVVEGKPDTCPHCGAPYSWK